MCDLCKALIYSFLMKTLIALITFFISLSAHGAPFEVPTGPYEYLESKISYLRDIQLFSVADEAGKEKYERLKEEHYICRSYPGEMMNCYKFLVKQNPVSLTDNEVESLVPHFGSLQNFDLEYRNRYEVVYTVFQNVEMPAGNVPGYRLHLREAGEHFIEIFQRGGAILRYKYETPELLNLLLKKRKFVDENHWQEYGINVYYKPL